MAQPKKLIEVAMPIKEISAESVRDKSIRHGHISTLHLWWARRPLPVCRAVVFASLVPDPLDENCPQAFRDAVDILLGSEKKPLKEAGIPTDAYKPYDDIPYTVVVDKVDDNTRNRLLMFIGKFSDEYSKKGDKTPAKDMLSKYSLIKWDNKNSKEIIGKARKLIWVAHNCKDKGWSAIEMLSEFDRLYLDITDSEKELYALPNRHIETEKSRMLTSKLQTAIDAFLHKMPKVFDPFAGGGAIPLEAARLGCHTFGNDINPVAHIIQKGSLEFPQKFGKPISFSKAEFVRLYGYGEFNNTKNEWRVYMAGEVIAINVPNRLSFDIEYYAKKLLASAEKEIGYLYPLDDKGNKPIAYYWVYNARCANPSCRASVPLLNQFYLVSKPDRKIYLKPIISGKDISFEIKEGTSNEVTWIERKNLKCPICGNITDIKELKRQFNKKEPQRNLIAVIEEGKNSKKYRLPNQQELDILNNIPETVNIPTEKLPLGNNRDLHCMGWGVSCWGDLFTSRQIATLDSLTNELINIKEELFFKNDNDYAKAVINYLGIFIDRIAVANTAFGIWHVGRETLERPMGRQAIPMVFDYPESNPFCDSGGSALNQLDWITRYVESECTQPFSTTLQNASSGERTQFPEKFLTCVVTDPPYYDAIAYADLSDFFYVWLKRTLADVFPLNFATPQTPKSEECTALKHHHNGEIQTAKDHFENKLLQIFDAIEHQTTDMVSIMFAHQSTEAWTTLCNSILGARMNITGSWATDSEMTGALKTDKSYLSSSVTVSCKPSQRIGIGNYKDVKKAIEKTVGKEVDELYKLGFRGADLLTACFGQAVSEFGKYEKVEKADGSQVTVAELLELARESAFNALLQGFDGDDFTKFYIAWMQINGFMETDFNDAVNFTRVGLSIDVQDLFKEHILIKKGNKQHLGSLKERIKLNSKIGEGRSSILIDTAHKLMHLYDSPNRNNLLKFIDANAGDSESLVWRVITSLAELLPKDFEDHKLAVGLLTNKDQLIRESKTAVTPKTEQARLTFE